MTNAKIRGSSRGKKRGKAKEEGKAEPEDRGWTSGVGVMEAAEEPGGNQGSKSDQVKTVARERKISGKCCI